MIRYRYDESGFRVYGEGGLSSFVYRPLHPINSEFFASHTPPDHPFPDDLASGFELYHAKDGQLCSLPAEWRNCAGQDLIEGVYLSLVRSNNTDVSSRELSRLLLFVVDYYFARLPWLLTVLLVADDRHDLVLREPELGGFVQLGRAQEMDHRVASLYELSRLRWDSSKKDHAKFDPELTATAGSRNMSASAVFLGTSSATKRAQYEFLLRSHGLQTLRPLRSLSLPEPQVEGYGPAPETALVVDPLKHASRWLARDQIFPFLIEDTMLFIEHFNSDYDNAPLLPGPDTKRWWSALGIEGLLAVMHGSTRRRAKYVCQLGVQAGPGEYDFYRAELEGIIATKRRVSLDSVNGQPYTNPSYFHSLFIPNDSNRTLAEMGPMEFAEFDYRRRCVATASRKLKSVARPFFKQEELPISG